MRIYVEGGGISNNDLSVKFRRAFKVFFEKAGLAGRLPSVSPCGGRQETFDEFCLAIGRGETAILLVDSESAVSDYSPWQHLRKRQSDQWTKPGPASDADCFLMIQCMETWFLADPQAIQTCYGRGTDLQKLPKGGDLSRRMPADVLKLLQDATQKSKRGKYDKAHAPDVLANLDPAAVRDRCPDAKRLLDRLK